MLRNVEEATQGDSMPLLIFIALVTLSLPLRTYITNDRVSIYNNRQILNSLDITLMTGKDSWLFIMSNSLTSLVNLPVYSSLALRR